MGHAGNESTQPPEFGTGFISRSLGGFRIRLNPLGARQPGYLEANEHVAPSSHHGNRHRQVARDGVVWAGFGLHLGRARFRTVACSSH